MNLMDAWLIEKFEKLAHWFQRWTGKTNYFLCKVCDWFIIAFILAIYGIAKIPVSFLEVFLLILVLADIAYLLPHEEKCSFERLEDGVANPAKDAFLARLIRVTLFLFLAAYLFLGIVISPVFFLYILYIVYFGGFFCHEYFYACDQLPPCRGRVWDVIGAFFAKSAMIEKES